jgi:hypothetical protein
MQEFGLDVIEGTGLQEQLIRDIGASVTREFIKDTAAVNRLFSIDQSTMGAFLGSRRMGALTNPLDVIQYMADGIDRSVLGDAIKNQTALMSVMGQTTGRVSGSMAQQMISEFNAVGGPFRVRDPRSAGLIGTIQGNLANPSNPFAQALSYSTLRNRKGGFLDLMIQRQQGGSGLLSGMMGGISNMGMSEDMQVMMFAQTMGLGNNLDAARRLFKERGKIGQGGVSSISVFKDQLYGQAESLTPEMEKASADVTNAFVNGVFDGLGTLADRFAQLVGKSLEQVISDVLWNRSGSSSDNSDKGFWDYVNMANPVGHLPQKNGQ